MREVAIIGAGDLGGATAHALARQNLARWITLIDERGHVAAGKALDISQAAPVEGFSTELSGTSDVSAAATADVIILADRFAAGEWPGEEALGIVRRVWQLTARALVICAGASYGDVIDRGVRELNMPRTRLLGSAPEALASGVRALVAIAIDRSARDVDLTLLGLPPTRTVIPWEDATVAGFALTRILDSPTRRAIDAKVRLLWPPGPLTLASAAAMVVAAIDGRSRRLVSCFVAPDDSAGVRRRTSAATVRLGGAGVVEVVLPSLSVVDRVALDNATML
jgi:malate dehydrogenase